jgi:NDP-sugar pyrophosphorylase family protein
MKAVILAAGEGTRLRPITYYIPKPMLPFYGKPFMAYTMENLSGLVESVVVVVNYRQEQIRDYFGNYFASLPIEYAIQQDSQGTGSAVMAARDFVDSKFLVIQGDVYTSRELSQDMVAIDDEYALSLVKVDDPENHAGVRHQGQKVKETLASSPWVDRGVWLLSSSIFDKIEEMRPSEGTYEMRMLTAIQKLIDHGVDVKAHLTYEPWIELGDHAPLESVLKALTFFREKSCQIASKGEQKSSITSLGFGESVGAASQSARACSDPRVRGNSRDCEIETGSSKIVNSLIFGNGRIIRSRIENSVVYLKGVVEDREITDRIVVLGFRSSRGK